MARSRSRKHAKAPAERASGEGLCAGLQGRTNRLAQAGDERVFQAVTHPLPGTFAHQHARGHQQGEVFGNVGLGGPGQFYNFAHIPGCVTDSLQDPQAHGLAEHLKEKGDLLELGGGGERPRRNFELTHE